MFRDKRFRSVFVIETLLPIVVVVLSVIATVFYNSAVQYHKEKMISEYQRAYDLYTGFHLSATILGFVTIGVVIVIGIIALVMMIMRSLSSRRKEKYYVARPRTIWLYSMGSTVVTLIIVFLLIAYTSGRGV